MDRILAALKITQDSLLRDWDYDRVYVTLTISVDGSGRVASWAPGVGPPPAGQEVIKRFRDQLELEAWAESVIADAQAALGSTVPPTSLR